MRRALGIIIVCTIVVVGFTVSSSRSVSSADPPADPTPTGCTKVGTQGRDIMSGDEKADRICSLAGNDYIASNGHADMLHGGSGHDTEVGGKGRDVLMGNAGSDKLFAIDQVESNDVLRGGTGNDRCFGEHGDHFFGCEHVYKVGTSPTVDFTMRVWSSQFLGIAQLGEQFQNDIVPPPPIPGVSTVTVTVFVPTPPECTPPPASPPVNPCT